MRHLDLLVLALALPVFVLADLPLEGYAAIAAVWLVQAAIQRVVLARALSGGGRARVMAMISGSIMARLFLVTVTILLVGRLVDDDAGLAAAVLAAALVTAHVIGEWLAGGPAPAQEAR